MTQFYVPLDGDCGESRIPELLGVLENCREHLFLLQASAPSHRVDIAKNVARRLHTLHDELSIEYARLGFDALTKLPLLGQFRAALTRTLRDARREREGYEVHLVLLDADELHLRNEEGGHLAGNALICEIARASRAVVPEINMVARIGGDELALFLTRVDSSCAQMVAERVCQSVLHSLTGTCSIGVATCPQDGITYDSLFKAADARLYESKRRGGNTVTAAF